MSTLVLDQSAIEKLRTVVVGTEVRDAQGALVGYFHPAVSPETVEQYECPLSEEELIRRGNECGGRSLPDILSDLGCRS